MKNKLRTIIHGIIALSILFFVLAPAAATAAYTGPLDTACDGNGTATVCTEKNKPHELGNNALYGPGGIISKIASILGFVIGVVAVVMIMVAGLKFLTSQGDANQVASARNTILYAVVGLAVAVMAQALVLFVLDRIK